MTDQQIPRNFGAVPAPNGRGWTAWFIAPGIGIRWVVVDDVVTREGGRSIKSLFASEERALIAAARAKDAAEDEGRAPLSPSAKAFTIHRNGKSVRTEAVRQRARR